MDLTQQEIDQNDKNKRFGHLYLLNEETIFDQMLVLTIGADEPIDLEDNMIVRRVQEYGKEKGYSSVEAGRIRLFGQNHLAQRDFYLMMESGN